LKIKLQNKMDYLKVDEVSDAEELKDTIKPDLNQIYQEDRPIQKHGQKEVPVMKNLLEIDTLRLQQDFNEVDIDSE
jgi:hypothetical protein